MATSEREYIHGSDLVASGRAEIVTLSITVTNRSNRYSELVNVLQGNWLWNPYS